MFGPFRELGLSNPLLIARTLRNLVRTVWDPTRSDVRQGINQLVYRALADAAPDDERRLAQAAPELAALFREGYDPALHPERLARLPEGTLGREWARFVSDNDIRPLETLLALRAPRNLLEYQFRRAYKLHDLMHVVLGADASVLGEVRIVAYSLGQSPSRDGGRVRAPVMALAVLFMNIGLRRPHEMRAAVRLAAEWLCVGEQSPWHVAFRIEDWLERPVRELRERLVTARDADAPPRALGDAALATLPVELPAVDGGGRAGTVGAVLISILALA
jgi:ubiquinone biosynthesis protein COQ4